MRRLAAVFGLLVAGGSAFAGSCGTETCAVSTKIMPPVTVYRQPPPGPVEAAPGVTCPGPKIYTATAAPPVFLESKPLPPVTLFTRLPREVTLLTKSPLPVTLFRMETSPPIFVTKPPPPAPTVFAKTIGPAECLPGVALPPVAIFRKTQPPPACCATAPEGQPH